MADDLKNTNNNDNSEYMQSEHNQANLAKNSATVANAQGGFLWQKPATWQEKQQVWEEDLPSHAKKTLNFTDQNKEKIEEEAEQIKEHKEKSKEQETLAKEAKISGAKGTKISGTITNGILYLNKQEEQAGQADQTDHGQANQIWEDPLSESLLKGARQEQTNEREYAIEDQDQLYNWIRYYCSILALLGGIVLLIILPYSLWWVYSSGDIAFERVSKQQSQGEFSLFAPANEHLSKEYHLQLYKDVKPEIVILGSSRVLQFRANFFNKSFVNLGGMVNSLQELQIVVDQLLREHRPSTVIIGLDFWWFSNRISKESTNSEAIFKLPWFYLLNLAMPFKEFFSPFGEQAKGRFGLKARLNNEGFGSDGSFYHTMLITGQKLAEDRQFKRSLSLLARGQDYFVPLKEVRTEDLEFFAEICCRLSARGIRPLVFLPPLASPIYKSLEAQKEAYPHLFTLRSLLAKHGIEVLDRTNPKLISTSDCEFLDGLEAGEIIAARLTRDLADQYPYFADSVRLGSIAKILRDWRGNVMASDLRVTNLTEIDFLQLECNKKATTNNN